MLKDREGGSVVRVELVPGPAPHQNIGTVITGDIQEHAELSVPGVLTEGALSNPCADGPSLASSREGS